MRSTVLKVASSSARCHHKLPGCRCSNAVPFLVSSVMTSDLMAGSLRLLVSMRTLLRRNIAHVGVIAVRCVGSSLEYLSIRATGAPATIMLLVSQVWP